jgi:nicotinamide phosphoribosyltransferase
MCAGGDDSELQTFRHLMRQFPTGPLSIVSDTWDLWKVLTVILPALKDEIMARDGKIIIRPDSGDPADIVCGSNLRSFSSIEEAKEYFEDELYENQVHGEQEFDIEEELLVKVGNEMFNLISSVDWNRYDKQYYHIESISIEVVAEEIKPLDKGVVELLWDLFGGTTNDQGFKVLDPHIGAIYGDSITPARQEDICKRLSDKGFASTNIVFGIGSFTYQFNTRDTFGFAMKATYVEVMTNIDGGNNAGSFIPMGRPIFKDPITDDGTKKSARGLLRVNKDMTLTDEVSWLEEGTREGYVKLVRSGVQQSVVSS